MYTDALFCFIRVSDVEVRWDMVGCYCCNLSPGVALNARFTTNGMCAKNNTHMYVARTNNNRSDLCCCLLPQCEDFRTFRSSFRSQHNDG